MECTDNVPSRLEGPSDPTFINSGGSAVNDFPQDKSVRGSNHNSIVEDVKNIVYRPFAFK